MRKIKLGLYVTGGSAYGVQALRNLELLENRYPNYEFEIEVIDMLEHPRAASEARVIAAPTLLKITPPPVCRIVGDLTDLTALASALALQEPQHDSRARESDSEKGALS